MKLSELIAAYGDDKVTFQKLDDCASTLDMNKRRTTITFITPERLSLGGTEKLGLVIWLDREKVSEIIESSRRAAPAPPQPVEDRP